MFDNYNDILTVDELCDILNISTNTAYVLLRSNQIASFKCGRGWTIPKSSVISYIQNSLSLTASTTKKHPHVSKR